jgi:uncharacterized protein YxeA
MKKFMMALVCLMTMVLTSCGTTYNVTANYEVCYPDGTRSFSETTKIKNAYSEPVVVSYSVCGTNYISVSCSDNPIANSKKASHFITTTAPVRLTGYNVQSNKKKGKKTAYTKLRGDEVYMSDILSH